MSYTQCHRKVALNFIPCVFVDNAGVALKIKYEESAQTPALKNVLGRKPSPFVCILSAANTYGQFWWLTWTHENVKSLVRE